MSLNYGAKRRLLRVPWTARRSNQSILREINHEYLWKDWCWRWNSSILVIECEQLTHWKSPWCWERLRAGGKEGVRGWNGWMASLMQWTWTWANFGSWWGTERPGVLQSMGLQRVGHDWVTVQQQCIYNVYTIIYIYIHCTVAVYKYMHAC